MRITSGLLHYFNLLSSQQYITKQILQIQKGWHLVKRVVKLHIHILQQKNTHTYTYNAALGLSKINLIPIAYCDTEIISLVMFFQGIYAHKWWEKDYKINTMVIDPGGTRATGKLTSMKLQK